MLVKPALTGRSSKRGCLGFPGVLSQASEQALTYCESSALQSHGAPNTMFLLDGLSVKQKG